MFSVKRTFFGRYTCGPFGTLNLTSLEPETDLMLWDVACTGHHHQETLYR